MARCVLLALALMLEAPLASAQGGGTAAIVSSIESQGGDVKRDAKGAVVEVSLARTWANDADVARIARLNTIRRLDLSLTYVSDAGADQLKTLANLEELNLFAAEFITDAAMAFLRGNRRLTALNLRGTDVTDTSLAYIAELSNLKSLDVSFTQITDVGLEHLASLAQLEELNLGGNKITGASLHVLKLLPKLRKLSFYGIQRRNAGWCWAPVVTDLELDTISRLGGLEDLNVGFGVALGTPRPEELGPADSEAECRIAGGTRVTDLGATKLSALKKLRVLDLSGAAITEAGITALASLPNLQRLSLWNVKALDDAMAVKLASIQTLTSLDLSNTAIGDETVARLSRLPNLRRLYVNETRVTPGALAAFRKQHPSASVSADTRPAPRLPLLPAKTGGH
jgi:Leucine rich repeat/Leucine Rich repeat